MTTEQKLLYEILGKVNAIETKVEVNTVYQKGHGTRLDKLEPKVDDLIAQKNVSIGKKTVWTIIAGSVGAGVTALLTALKHL